MLPVYTLSDLASNDPNFLLLALNKFIMTFISYKSFFHFFCDNSLLDNIFRKAVVSDIHKKSLRKMPQFHLFSSCGNFAERHSFRIVSGDSFENMRKRCISTKFPHQEIR